MTVFYSPDNVLRTESRVTAKEYAIATTHHGGLVDDWTIPVVELNTNVVLNPRKSIVLTDGQNNVVAGNRDLANRHLVDDPAIFDLVFHLLKQHTGQPAILHHKLFG